jgi:hypothetical protein
MARVGSTSDVDHWRLLEIYRQRYRIEDRLGPLQDLEKSIKRRRVRSVGLTRAIEALERELERARAELHVVETEIEGTKAAGALLISEIIDRVREDMAEAWSPTAVRGFRVWRIEDGSVMGNQVCWPEPRLSSVCLRDIPGDDVPHTAGRCGPPACGIYAVKQLMMFPDDVSAGRIKRSIVGVVAMSGKVVEHEAGYRAAHARVVAAVANCGGRLLMTDDSPRISALFDDPVGAMSEWGGRETMTETAVRDFLESSRRKEEQWT